MIILFDTNAYRDLCSPKNSFDSKTVIDKICKAEQKKGYKAYMSTTVALELMYHLQDPKKWNSYRSCVKAAPAMYLHCKEDDNTFRLIPLPEVQIAQAYLGVDNQVSKNTQIGIGQIFYDLTVMTPESVLQKHAENIQRAHDFITQAEMAIACEVDMYLTLTDPNYTHDWNPFKNDESSRTKYLNLVRSEEFANNSAVAMIYAVADMLNRKNTQVALPTGQHLVNLIRMYKQDYAVSNLFRKRFFEYAANGGFNITQDSRANYRWDEFILQCAGHSINREQIMIVTSDTKMLSAITDTNSSYPCKRLVDYLLHIGIEQNIIDEIKKNTHAK